MASPQPAQKQQPQPAPKPAAPAFTSRLGGVQKGRLRTPYRIVIYGPEGSGKSTLAAAAPDVIFLDAEGGSENLSVFRYPFREGEGGHKPRDYAELLYAIEDLTVSKHEYKTLVLDTADKVEALMWKWMLTRDSAASARNKDGVELTSIEDYGFGKGYIVAMEEWRHLLARLERLRDRAGMNVVILGHTQVKNFKNPEGTDFDRYQLRIHERAGGLLKEWADVVGFLGFEQGAKKPAGEGKFAKAKGWATDRRILRTQRTAAFDAKTRLPLPEEVEISIEDPWAPIAAAIEASYEDKIPVLVAEIKAETDRIGDAELTAKVESAVAAAKAKNDEIALGRYVVDLKKRPAKESV
jgi:hypothetical protein